MICKLLIVNKKKLYFEFKFVVEKKINYFRRCE